MNEEYWSITKSAFISPSKCPSLCPVFSPRLGQMVRGRSVVLRAAGEGRPCPEQLTQHRSCPVKPCYSWLLGPWSPCRVQVWLSPASASQGLLGFPAARFNNRNRHGMAELIEATILGVEVSLWALTVPIRSVGEQGESGAVNLCTSSSTHQQWFIAMWVQVPPAYRGMKVDLRSNCAWVCAWVGIVTVTYNLIV